MLKLIEDGWMKMFKLSSVYPTASALFSAFFLYLSNDNFSRFDHFANVSQEVQHNHHCIAANWLPKLEWKSFDFVLIAPKNKQPWPFQGRAPLQIQMKIGKKIRVRTVLGLCDGWDGPLNLIKRNQKLDRLERRRKNDFFFNRKNRNNTYREIKAQKFAIFFFFALFTFVFSKLSTIIEKNYVTVKLWPKFWVFLFFIFIISTSLWRERKKSIFGKWSILIDEDIRNRMTEWPINFCFSQSIRRMTWWLLFSSLHRLIVLRFSVCYDLISSRCEFHQVKWSFNMHCDSVFSIRSYALCHMAPLGVWSILTIDKIVSAHAKKKTTHSANYQKQLDDISTNAFIQLTLSLSISMA